MMSFTYLLGQLDAFTASSGSKVFSPWLVSVLRLSSAAVAAVGAHLLASVVEALSKRADLM